MAEDKSGEIFDAMQLRRMAVSDGVVEKNFYDPSDGYANHLRTTIGVEHVASGQKVFFKAFIVAFNETYSPDWAMESVYGRADPIVMFKQTTRNISVGFKIPAASESEAFQNLSKVQKLIQFLYPNYTNIGSATTIAQSPLTRLRVINLLKKSGGGDYGGRTFDKLSTIGAGEIKGALGVIKNVSITHNLETDIGVMEMAPGVILPKLIEVNFDFTVIHENHLGWSGSKFSNPSFPYNLDFENSEGSIQNPGAQEARGRAIQMSSFGNFPVTVDPVTGEQTQDKDSDAVKQAREAAQREQNRANAEARYVGLLGNFRYKRDDARSDRAIARGLKAQESMDSAIEGSRKYERLERRKNRAGQRFAYLESSRAGYDEFIGD
jgi:hypothetical protein